MRIKKTNAVLKRPLNKLFPTEYTYHETNQTDKAAVIDEVKRKYECQLSEHCEGEVAFEHYKY